MHKLTLYLNDDQYAVLNDLRRERGFESAEEAANEILYSDILYKYRLQHLGEQLRKVEDSTVDRTLIPKLTPSCPYCGSAMKYAVTEEGTLHYGCEKCGAEARICPFPDYPEDCKVEFSLNHYTAAVRRRDSFERPGYVVTVYIYTGYDVACADVENADANNLSIYDLGEIAGRAFREYLPFAERYTSSDIEAALKEYAESSSLKGTEE